MKKFVILIACSIVLTACNSGSPPHTENNIKSNTIIDWEDFVKINGTKFEAAYDGVIADPKYIGDEIGEVEFNVKGNISNPSYSIKDGDAAYLDKGTKLFEVKNMPGFIAIKDDYEVNSYRIYYSDHNVEEFNWHFKDIDQGSISKIEIYEDTRTPQLVNTISDEREITEFTNLLKNGETKASFSPNPSSGNPKRYQMIFYNDQPIARSYTLSFEENTRYWHPWDTEVLSNEIERYIKSAE